MRARRAHCALGLALILAAPAGAARAAGNTAPPAVVPAAAPVPHPVAKPLQSVRGDHVQIEGKLYSPQALFVMTRRDESFSRDAILPHYLAPPSDATFLPYRLRTEVVTAPEPAPRP